MALRGVRNSGQYGEGPWSCVVGNSGASAAGWIVGLHASGQLKVAVGTVVGPVCVSLGEPIMCVRGSMMVVCPSLFDERCPDKPFSGQCDDPVLSAEAAVRGALEEFAAYSDAVTLWGREGAN